MEFDSDELRRYSRHLSLPEVGLEGQKKIRAASVLCIGAGGLGSPIADVPGRRRHRQARHRGFRRGGPLQPPAPDSPRHPGCRPAQDPIRRGTPSTASTPTSQVVLHDTRLTSANALDIIRPYDIVVDGTDNFPTRYLANDACVLLRKPNVYGSVFRFEGQASLFAPHLGGPCYRCLYPEPPPPGTVPSCAEGGVLGVLPGIIGLIQATEVLKLILGRGTSLLNRLLLFDALEMRFREVKLRRDPQCPLCGEEPTITQLIDYEAFCGAAPPAGTTMPHPDEVPVQDLKRALDHPRLSIQALDVREPYEYQIARINGTRLFPLTTLAQRFTELDPNQAYYLHCRTGVRSLQALQFLRERGFKHLKSVKGGIAAWSDEIDPTVPKY